MPVTDTANVSDLYASLPLPRESTFIRVLDVYGTSSPDESDGSIQCDLRVINLESENHPSFATLSYVWGIEASNGHFIICRGLTLGVTANCHSALRHLKEKFGNLTIWIDAICINQEDEAEKMKQIMLMGDIYSKAETVYVWMGEGNAATNRAMAYLETTGYLRSFFHHEETDEVELRQPRHWNAAWWAFLACFNLPIGLSRSLNYGLDQALPNFGRLKHVRASYQDMNDLLDREWIRRIWTYQEILLASNPVIVCGGFHLAWDRFSLSVTFLEYSGINYRQGDPMIATVNTWAQLASSRDYLISTQATGFANIQSSRRNGMSQTTLQRYRKFVIYISQIVVLLRRLNFHLMLLGLAIVVVCAMLWIMLRNFIGSPTIVSTVPSEVVSAATKASYSAAACVVACAASDIAACAETCEAAGSAAGSVASLSADLTNKIAYQTLDRTFGPLFGTVFLAFSISFIVFLGSARRKQPRLEHVPIAQNAGVHLVDGICGRKSKEKKDKAIGVQAVLQRLSKTAILPIHNAHSLEHMYKQLCIQLLEVTDSLQFLLPASMNSFPKHPSWVPNWAAEFDSFWLKSTLFRNRPGTATPGSRAYWRLDPRKDNILGVRGRQLCTVARCFWFRETFDMYDPSQWELHRKNLRCILQCPLLFEKQDKTVSSILKQMSDFKLQPPINERQIHAWKLFMRERRHQKPETLLSVLEGRDSMFAPSVRFPDWIRGRSSLRTLLHTQISICNSLAKKGRIIFATTDFHIETPPAMRNVEAFLGVDGQQETSWMPRSIGVGSCNARAGDSVVLIAGVFSPLIIRRDSVSTRIVSPAAVQGVMEGEKWDTKWKAEDLEEFILS